ncbi:hypothetical protein BC832DRAFT_541787 [Gaertneriomyces semiglobifer]|nr:hypothetical protein BC832DRAFT_541787 [Gaertneriomyces semiglobifer]
MNAIPSVLVRIFHRTILYQQSYPLLSGYGLSQPIRGKMWATNLEAGALYCAISSTEHNFCGPLLAYHKTMRSTKMEGLDDPRLLDEALRAQSLRIASLLPANGFGCGNSCRATIRSLENEIEKVQKGYLWRQRTKANGVTVQNRRVNALKGLYEFQMPSRILGTGNNNATAVPSAMPKGRGMIKQQQGASHENRQLHQPKRR